MNIAIVLVGVVCIVTLAESLPSLSVRKGVDRYFISDPNGREVYLYTH